MLLNLPAELRLAVYAELDRVSLVLLAATSRALRVEARFTELTIEERYLVSLTLLIEQDDRAPSISRAVCAKCVAFHPPTCFFHEELQRDRRYRQCKASGVIALCSHRYLTLGMLRGVITRNQNDINRFRTIRFGRRVFSHLPCFFNGTCACCKQKPSCLSVQPFSIRKKLWSTSGRLIRGTEHNCSEELQNVVLLKDWLQLLKSEHHVICSHFSIQSDSMTQLLRRLTCPRNHEASSKTPDRVQAIHEKEHKFRFDCAAEGCQTTLDFLYYDKGPYTPWLCLRVRRDLGPMETLLGGDISCQRQWMAHTVSKTTFDQLTTDHKRRY